MPIAAFPASSVDAVANLGVHLGQSALYSESFLLTCISAASLGSGATAKLSSRHICNTGSFSRKTSPTSSPMPHCRAMLIRRVPRRDRVAQPAHRREESQPQILVAHMCGEIMQHRFVFGTQWSHSQRRSVGNRSTDSRSLGYGAIASRAVPALCIGATRSRASRATTPALSASGGLTSSSRISG